MQSCEKRCTTCACSQVCVYKNTETTECAHWIGEDELYALRKAEIRPAFVKAGLQLYEAEGAEAGDRILNVALQSVVNDLRKYLESFDPYDHPLVLSTMTVFANIHTANMPPEIQALTNILTNATRCIHIDTTAIREQMGGSVES